ncbi:sulfatase-like hydrolase/transferase [uncultured Shewanella sp.]|uniref:sulfatase-like hydrolase/transferase n=1 Tax=uncultured Shewanella sp. TaxID=173975 RepID=UPI002614011B|nr:sulfatase-like hydrolase/transferase [uncultured Shewanella sp.]
MFSYLTFTENLALLFTAPLPLIAMVLPAVSVLGLLSVFFSGIKGVPKVVSNLARYAIPAMVLTCTAFLMLDNFSYTMFGIASHSAASLASQAYYWIIISLFFIYFMGKLAHASLNDGVIGKHYGALLKLMLVLLGLSSLCLAVSYNQPISTVLGVSATAERDKLPNIIFFGADGVNSSNMSIYGYQRITTPFLDSIAHESLVYRNHWTNSAKTTGSIGSLLTGKYPTRTKVIFRPDTFKGEDMFQHLPGILRELGYYNIDISLRHYIDSEDLKMRNSFDYANHRQLDQQGSDLKNFFLLRWPSSVQFIEENWQRLFQRLAHLSGYISMVYPHKLVNQGAKVPPHLSDIGRINQLKAQILQAPKPFFANVHLLGPHGSRFDYQEPIFTKTKEQPEHWMIDHYDNAIYQWDAYSREIYTLLEELGELDNTLLIFSSDHGKGHTVNETLPLIIRYPNKEYTGSITQASQRMDIAPTVLSYLGVTPPQWMDGHSLLSREEDSYPIFIVTSSKQQLTNAGEWKVAANLKPPFYSLGTISMAYCGILYSMDINDIQHPLLSQQRVHSKAATCPDVELEPMLAYGMIVTHLKEMGYNTDQLNVESRLRQ